QDEVLGINAGLDVFQALAHSLAGFFGNNLRTGLVLAVFSVVGDRVVHVGDTAFVDQVHDQLELVQALEVSHFRRVTRFYQRIEACFDQLNRTAAQNSLFTEQVGFGFFAEVGFDDTGTTTAVSRCVGQSHVASSAGLVLVNSDQVRNAAALAVGATNRVTRSLGSNHDDVDIVTGHNLAVVNVKAVSKCQSSARLDVLGNLVAVNLSNVFVGQQDHDDVSALDGFGHFLNFQASVLGFAPGSAAFAQTHNHIHAGLVQVQGVGVALRTVADDGNGLAFDQGKITILVVENFHFRCSKFNNFA